MTSIILKSLNGLAKQKSYGNKTLSENIASAEEAILKVQYTERIWDRSRSQWMLKHLTCSQADGWMRLRQVSAEMAKKRMAYSEAKFGYLERLVKTKIKRQKLEETEDELQKELLEVQIAKNEAQSAEVLIKVEGALKEIETLATMHDQLKEILGEVNEEEYEMAQVKSHIKRALMQATREVRESGTIKCGNQEYLEQIGVCVTSARKAINEYLAQELSTEIGNTSLLHSFLDSFADDYAGVAKQQADWLGFDQDADMKLTYTPRVGEADANI
jgi:hypothetical protein